jgi:hypothetical protein
MGCRYLKTTSHLNIDPLDFEDEAPLELSLDLEEFAGRLVFEEGIIVVLGGALDGRVILLKEECSEDTKTF